MQINIKGKEGLVRDTQSMALLNVNKSSLSKDAIFKEKMRREKEVDESIDKLSSEITEIKQNLSEILTLLRTRGL